MEDKLTADQYVVMKLQELEVKVESLTQQNNALQYQLDTYKDEFLFLTGFIKKYGHPIDPNEENFSVYLSEYYYSWEHDEDKKKEIKRIAKYFPVKEPEEVKEEEKEEEEK